MRSTKFVWFLAALSVMLLGIGVGEYAHLGSTSAPSSVTSAIRAVSPTVRTAAPQTTVPARTVPFTELGPKPTLPEQTVPLTAPAPKPTAPKQTVPVTKLGPNPTVPEQTVPLTAPAPKPTAPKQTVPSTAPAQRAPTTSTSRTGLPLRTTVPVKNPVPPTSTVPVKNPVPPTSTVPVKNPVPPTSTVSSPGANAGRGGKATHTAPPVRTAGRSNVAGRGVQPPKPTHLPLHGTAAHGQTGRVYVVKTHDTLWALAATHLGNPNRWSELFNLNRDRAEPGGRLVDPNLIYRGWTLELPVSVKAVSPDKATPETAIVRGPPGRHPLEPCRHASG